MSNIHKLEHWADTHHPAWIDFLRVVLGLFIFYKGVSFIQDTGAILEMLKGSAFTAFAKLSVVHYIAFAHLVGGIFIAAGLLTRLAILIQIPILLGAVFFVNFPQGLSHNIELELSIITLVLLLVFLFYGSGKISLDNYMRQQ